MEHIPNIILLEHMEEIEHTPSVKTPETLDAKTEKKIKQSRASVLRESGEKKATAKDVDVLGYYGTYNGCVALRLTDSYSAYARAGSYVVIKGANIIVKYYSSNNIVIWKENNQKAD